MQQFNSVTKFRQILVQWLPPEIAAHALIEEWGPSGFIWLDGDKSEFGRWALLGIDPIEHICCHDLASRQKTKNPFEILKGLKPGHWTGWLSYEAGKWTEPNNPWKKSSMSTLWLGSHDPILKFDLKKKQLWIEGYNKKRIEIINNFLKKVSVDTTRKIIISKNRTLSIPIGSWEWLTSKNDYLLKVKYIKELIAKGDIFQANLTACCTTSIPKQVSPLNLYLRLRKHSPAPFGGLIIGAGLAKNEAIISVSPERFLKVLPTGEVETRPIKGTRTRKSDKKNDADMAIELITSLKDRAENLMIVDLLRNDLGRVCEFGSIHVSQLMGLESYSHVHHLTSVIKGKLHKSKTWIDLLEASWPGGSITGAPKVRACQRIYELEPIARGAYCGSLLHIKWDGTFDSNILIRSLIIEKDKIKAHAGCGIVADSNPEKEVEELNWKLMPLLNALT